MLVEAVGIVTICGILGKLFSDNRALRRELRAERRRVLLPSAEEIDHYSRRGPVAERQARKRMSGGDAALLAIAGVVLTIATAAIVTKDRPRPKEPDPNR